MTNDTNKITVNSWLSELSNEYHFQLDEQGFCALANDGIDIEINVPNSKPAVFLTAKISDLAQEHREAVLYQAMTLNLYQGETNGATIALDPNREELLLCYSSALGACDAVSFSNILINFTDTTKSLRERILAPDQDGHTSGDHTHHDGPESRNAFEFITP